MPRVVVHAGETGSEQLLCPKLAGAVVIARAYPFIEMPSTNNDRVGHVSPSRLGRQLNHCHGATIYVRLGHQW
jgi:hypothetical protein